MSFSHVDSLWSPSLPLSSTLKDPCDYVRPNWTIQDNLLILRSFSWFAFLISSALIPIYPVRKYSQKISGIKTWMSVEGPLFCQPHKTERKPDLGSRERQYLSRLLAKQTSLRRYSRTKGSQCFPSQDRIFTVNGPPIPITTSCPYIFA